MADDKKLDFSGFLDDYLNDAREGFQAINSALLALEKDPSQTQRLDETFRVIHTLKSSATMLEFSHTAELAHICEDFLDRLRKKELAITQEVIDLLFEITDTLEEMVREQAGAAKGRGGEGEKQRVKQVTSLKSRVSSWEEHLGVRKDEDRDLDPGSERATRNSKLETGFELETRDSKPEIERLETIRVHVDLLDSLFNLVGELIITKNRIDNILSDTEHKELKAALKSMDRMIAESQETVSAARLVPVDEIFRKFPRMVRDLAREQGKEIELVLEGQEIELDKAVLDALSEPLIHLLRNAVDHGIEPAKLRQKRKKNKAGTIRLAAKRAENHIVIDVDDDGGGIDIARMKNAAVKQGLLSLETAGSLLDKDALDLLFAPGVSSADEVSELSGRGVGLDVVRTSARKMGGTVEVATQEGNGTRFTLKLPLTTAVIQTLMVGVGKQVFAIPSDVVLETLEIAPGDLKEIQDQQVLVLRQRVIPFVKLSDALNIPNTEDQEEMIAVIIYRGDSFIALGVDNVLDQLENIIKPFDPIAQGFTGFSGGTILGDGRVALLLDVPALPGFRMAVAEAEMARYRE